MSAPRAATSTASRRRGTAPTSQVEAPFSRRVRAEPTSEKWKHSFASMIFRKKNSLFSSRHDRSVSVILDEDVAQRVDKYI